MADITLPVEFIFLYAIIGGTVLTSVVYFVGRKAWATAIAKPDSNLRKAFRKALGEDVKPVVDEAISKGLAHLDTDMLRVEHSLSDLKLEMPKMPEVPDYGPRLDSLEKSLQPFLAEAEITYADGTKAQANALLATIQNLPNQMIASMNDWLASDEAKGMLAKRRMAAEKQARAALEDFQGQVEFAEAHPVLAAQGARVAKVEAAAKKYLENSKLSPEVKSIFNEGIEIARANMQKGGQSSGSSGSGANWVTDI